MPAILAIIAALGQVLFTSTSDLVVVPVSVTDARGRPVDGLTQEMFRVYDEGKPQPITTFQRGDAPITVGLVVDSSASMRVKLPAVARAITAFGRSARPSDELFVVSFNDRVQRGTFAGRPFTSDGAEVTARLSAVMPYGTTALYDALLDGTQHLASGRWIRKALIVVSDGADNASRGRLTDVTAAARRVGAIIYAIGLSMEAGDREGNNVLGRLARDSGGIAFFPSIDEVGTALERVSSDLRDQYVLGFAPQAAAGGAPVRGIKVEVSSPGSRGFTVRSRTSYSLAEVPSR